MGSNTSKPNTETAIITKNSVNVCNPDPRSPTPEITRTPLQDKTGNKHNITKNVDLRKTFENAQDNEKLIHNNPILSAVINSHLQSYDPRSPTQDFERTPIIIASKIDELAHDEKTVMRLYSENCASPLLSNSNEDLDNYVQTKKATKLILPVNLCNELFDMTVNETIKDSEGPFSSSTASTENIENNISNINLQSSNQPTRLLETNFDYNEDNNDKFEDSEENINHSDNLEKTDDDIKCIPVFKILDLDPRSPSIGIERTPIVVPKIDNSDDNVEDMSDDILIKVLQNKNAELRETVTKSQDKNEEGVLIYEDDSVGLNDTPKKCKSTSNTGSRTPLSCMKNKSDAGHTRSKSANLLYNPKTQKVVPSKVPKRVSHIPRLKSLSRNSNLVQTGSSVSLKTLSKNPSIGGDCENTPPQSHCDLWDKNNSIVL